MELAIAEVMGPEDEPAGLVNEEGHQYERRDEARDNRHRDPTSQPRMRFRETQHVDGRIWSRKKCCCRWPGGRTNFRRWYGCRLGVRCWDNDSAAHCRDSSTNL
jgi:hypothetical protein